MFDILATMHQDRTVKVRALALATGLSVFACLPPTAVAPTSAPAPTASATPLRTAVPAATTAPPATPSPTVAAPPATVPSPATACQRATGGNSAGGGALSEVRFGSQSGFERVVFDFAAGALPQYTIEQAVSFIAPSGQTVSVQGNTHFGVRFNGAGGMGSYRGPTSFRPASALIRELKLVEDFEGVLVWGVGLERVSCPRILVLSSPTRLVLDFP